MKTTKLLTTLAIGATLLTPINADTLKTFGCGITKSAYLAALNKAFTKKTSTSTEVNTKGGAARAIKEVGKGAANIGSGCRPTLGLKGEENTKYHQVGWGALVFIVHHRNPVDSISLDQAKAVLQGKIINWSELGGKDGKIQLLLRKGETSGVGYSTRSILLGDAHATLGSDAKLLKSSGPIRIEVSHNKLAFAVDDISSSKKNKRVKILKVDGLAASKENIISGAYSLYRPLYIYTKGAATGTAKEFLDFAFSKEGQEVISKAGTVNLEEGNNLKSTY